MIYPEVQIWQQIEDICQTEGYSDPQLSREGEVWAFNGNAFIKTRVELPQILRLEAKLLQLGAYRLELWQKHKREIRRQGLLMIPVMTCLFAIPALGIFLDYIVENSTSVLFPASLGIASQIINALFFSALGVGSVFFLRDIFMLKDLNTKRDIQYLQCLSVLGLIALSIQAGMLVCWYYQVQGR